LEDILKQLKGVAKFKLLLPAAAAAVLLNNSHGCLHLITCISKKVIAIYARRYLLSLNFLLLLLWNLHHTETHHSCILNTPLEGQ
jgi:hypothetical protein